MLKLFGLVALVVTYSSSEPRADVKPGYVLSFNPGNNSRR